MKQDSTIAGSVQQVTWESLESYVRGKVQQCVQEVLEAEVTQLLRRGKCQRGAAVDAAPGYRNGYGKACRLTLGSGTITVRRLRVRGLQERFESRVLPLSARGTRQVGEPLPELYLHGLAEGGLDRALRGLLGEEATLSATTVARFKGKWQERCTHPEMAAWQSRRLGNLEVVYLWVDGVYVKAGLENRKAAILVLIAGLSDGRKVLLALQSGHRESSESWARALRDLRSRGLRPPRLVIGDGHLGIWGGLRQVYPEAQEQRCWNHRVLNVLDRVAKRHQPVATDLLRKIAYAETVEQAGREKATFQRWCREQGYAEAAAGLDRDWDRMITFYAFPREHWRHLRTTNPVESPFAALRLRTAAAKRFKKVENATAVIWQMLLLAERRLRRLNAPELMNEVFQGATYLNGLPVQRQPEAAAA